MNLKYYLEYKYKDVYSCEESGCDQICRCMEIRNPRVTEVNMSYLVETFYNGSLPKDKKTIKRRKKIDNLLEVGDTELIDSYCINRILTLHKVWDPDSYEFKIRAGYYGDEIEEILLINQEEIIQKCMDLVYSDSSKDKINYVLQMEYGELIEDFEDVKLIKINKKDLRDYNKNHFAKINKEVYYNSVNYLLPRGIVKEIGPQKYQIIDGYHRIKSSDLDEVIVWKII